MSDYEKNIHKYMDHKLFENTIIVAPQNSGKTYFVKKMVEKYGSLYDLIYVSTPHEDNPILSCHKKCRHLPCDDETMTRFIEELHEARKQQIDFKLLLILDDYLGFLTFNSKKSQYVTKIGSSSRHLRLSTIWITQSWTNNVPNVLKASCMHVFLMPRLPENQIEAISQILPQCEFTNHMQLYNEYKKLTGTYNFVYINKSGKSKKPVYFCSAIRKDGRFRFHELQRDQSGDRPDPTAIRELRDHFERIKQQSAEELNTITGLDSERRKLELQQGFTSRTRIVQQNPRRKM